jgi:hypothetical protein
VGISRGGKEADGLFSDFGKPKVGVDSKIRFDSLAWISSTI